MSMERNRCKLCSRIFSNGRALGGHMRSHLATLPLPAKKTEHQQLGYRTESDSSSTRSEHDEHGVVYGLRENPKKSVKGSDRGVFDAGSVVVQDRESETESTQTPTRRRSKRASQRGGQGNNNGVELESKKLKLVRSESATESAPVSSVSDASQDEEVALCLMMMSRDVWVRAAAREEKSVEDTHDSAEQKTTRAATRAAARFKCLGCNKVFRTNRALVGHKASNKECQQGNNSPGNHKIYECPFCYKVFGSGQALGGHKRSHLLGASTSNFAASVSTNVITTNVDKVGDTITASFILDLNLPAPVEDDEDHSQLEFVRST